jgi:signal transduction histidine kinase
LSDLNTYRRSLLISILVTFTQPLCALDPELSHEQYVHQSWNSTNGFPKGRVDAITQSIDGYLWIGTDEGLIRFDGQTFKQFRYSSQNESSPDHVLGLVADPDGKLWVRLLQPSLLRYGDGTFTAARLYPKHDPLVTAIGMGRNGSVLFASVSDGLFTSEGGSLRSLINKRLLPSSSATAIAETRPQDIWVGTSDSGLLHVDGGKTTTVTRGLPSAHITCLLTGADTQLFVGTASGLVRWDGHALTNTGLPAILRSKPISALTRDRDGNIWIGTLQGLYRMDTLGNAVLQSNTHSKITALFHDREGDVWAGSPNELERIKESSFGTYAEKGSHVTDEGGPVFANSRGQVWTSPNAGVLVRIEPSSMSDFHLPQFRGDRILSISGDRGRLLLGMERHGLQYLDLPSNEHIHAPIQQQCGALANPISTVHKSRDGSIWIGTVAGGVTHILDDRCTIYTTDDGLPSNTVYSIAEGADGTIWFGTPSGVCSFSHDRWRSYTVEDGLPSANVHAIFVDSSDVVWVGTLNGLAFLRSGRMIVSSSRATERLQNQIFGITQDQRGSLWIAAAQAVFRVDRANLLADTLHPEDVREFGPSDGLVDLQGVPTDPTILTDRSGTVWISRPGGVVSINTDRLRRTSVPTIVHISEVSVDGNAFDLSRPLNLRSNTKRLSIRYQGLNLSDPEQIQYRSKLDGFDHGWNDSGYSKEADYTNLSPGSYHFHVIASNSDQTWDGPEATLALTVIPTLWQTSWFRLIMAIALLIAAATAYNLRLMHLTKQVNLQFEARFAERNRIARDLHDTLLQSFQGLILRFQAVQNIFDEKPEKAKRSLEIAIEDAARAVTEGREAVQQLRTGDASTSLVNMLTALGNELSVHAGGLKVPSYRVLLEGEPRLLRPRLQDDLYRICREAVTNAFRHAQANQIELDIQYDPKGLRLRIRDDGMGMDSNIVSQGGRAGHWGLPGMRERAGAMNGRLEIWSDANRGTEIELTIPSHVAYARMVRGKKRKLSGVQA